MRHGSLSTSGFHLLANDLALEGSVEGPVVVWRTKGTGWPHIEEDEEATVKEILLLVDQVIRFFSKSKGILVLSLSTGDLSNQHISRRQWLDPSFEVSNSGAKIEKTAD